MNEEQTAKLYKVLSDDGAAYHGGMGTWSLPHDGEPGDWMPPIADIEPCARGYHLCREGDIVRWVGPAIYEAEARGERIDTDDKIVVGEARLLRRCEGWNDRTARHFAADCAEHVLHLVPEPHRAVCATAIATARRYADGQATTDERAAAAAEAAAEAATGAWAGAEAASAAWAAAAAWDAARAASRAASDAAVLTASWAASGDASGAWAASRDAAWDAARAAEAAWQTQRLMAILTEESDDE